MAFVRSPGGRNLTLLGIGAIVITIIMTGTSLFIYRSSGDIYLDRSRPGYLPDREEVNEDAETTTNYAYPDTGAFDRAELDEYLKELQKIIDHLQSPADPYGPGPLSDESLGIPSDEPDKDATRR